MQQQSFFAILLVATNSFFNCATAENVYKCGNSYSQTPCADGKILTVDDVRSAAQKQEADDAARRNVGLAKSMEQDRLAQEKMASSESRSKKSSPKLTAAGRQNPPPAAPAHHLTPKKANPKGKKPDDFVAEVPGTAKTSVRKKATEKMKNSAAG